ncbi:Sua5/YciO/YrdC/YwlC family protein [Planctomycetota bacterium]|nr:Sua5/YciO/YrdC/YwlC family protein [Planctomycetota bacterium]
MSAKLYSVQQVQEAASDLLAGELIGFPTDTVYGIAALADESFHSTKLQTFKGGRANPFALHTHSVDFAIAHLSALTDIEEAAIRELAPVGVTVIVQGIGVRVVTHELGTAFLKAVGKPVVATSANTPTQPPLRKPENIAALAGVAGVIDAGELPDRVASTVLRVSNNGIEVLREGGADKGLVEAFRQLVSGQSKGE